MPGRGSAAVNFFGFVSKGLKKPYKQAKNTPGEKGRERGEGRDPSVSQSLSTCGCVSRDVFRFSLRFLGFFLQNLKNNKVSRGFFKKPKETLVFLAFLGTGARKSVWSVGFFCLFIKK